MRAFARYSAQQPLRNIGSLNAERSVGIRTRKAVRTAALQGRCLVSRHSPYDVVDGSPSPSAVIIVG
jgi:hypothetical protein